MPLKTHKVSIRQKRAVCMEIEARGITSCVDEPLESGGTNLGCTPIELLLGSLGSCLAITTFIYASMQGIQIDDIRVEVEGDINTDGMMDSNEVTPTGYQAIRYHFFVKSAVSEERIRQLIEYAEKKCPVGSTLRDGTTISGIELSMI